MCLIAYFTSQVSKNELHSRKNNWIMFVPSVIKIHLKIWICCVEYLGKTFSKTIRNLGLKGIHVYIFCRNFGAVSKNNNSISLIPILTVMKWVTSAIVILESESIRKISQHAGCWWVSLYSVTVLRANEILNPLNSSQKDRRVVI